mmetsp:Transcript_4420/g.14648  ORF Transcript_4420/g.14648 Transcript_4420/m.14648 type:complete len:837 (+) Transcript_4420:81-2591(+)
MRRLWSLVVASALERNSLRGGETSRSSFPEALLKGDVSLRSFEARLDALSGDLRVEPRTVAEKALAGLSGRADEAEVDELLAETAASLASRHPDYGRLAARVAMERRVESSFSTTMLAVGKGVLDQGFYAALESDAEFRRLVDEACAASEFEKDLDYFGYKTLKRSYLLRTDHDHDHDHAKTATAEEGQQYSLATTAEKGQHHQHQEETPSQMLMRAALGIHHGWQNATRLAKSLKTFELLSTRKYIHASPTLFHAGTTKPHLASCFLLGATDDSIEGIYSCLAQCALISKAAGGIGVSVSSVRASGSRIRGTGGESNGLVPMLRVFDATARYVDQGGGKRKGSFAIYLEPWHADIEQWLDLRKNHGNELERARDLFYGLWIPDLFMERVEANGSWSLFCPNECPGLADTHSGEFKELYERYEAEGRARKTIPAQQLWFAILDAQVETGTPYMLYKDACNAKSNQQHLGTIKSSNLCTEIVEYTAPDEIAVCNLASINLTAMVVTTPTTAPHFDFAKLRKIANVVARNLNKVIDVNYYPVDEAKNSNLRHRPIGIGVQGLADTFIQLRLPYESDGARQLNKDIFETIYYGAMEASIALAAADGKYETYEGSPTSAGQLQPDLWGVAPSARWDWAKLRADLAEHGCRNSLLLAPMPTASTAQILGNTESFEPITSNIYVRRTLAGEFPVVNKYLLQDLIKLDVWTPEVRNQLIAHNGSVQAIDGVPASLKALYKTVWEIKMKRSLELAADRGAFVCQSQSMNAYMQAPTTSKLTSLHFFAWRLGLKTGMYYLRTKPKADAIKFTVDTQMLAKSQAKKNTDSSNKENEEDGICLSCGA